MKNLTWVSAAIRDRSKRTGARNILRTESYNSFVLSYNMTKYSEPETHCS